ncbi:hypothetical protein [Nocardioides convexus]|uniref:hypothetical protein n=1 Tax=Nocardioides convexus TaxID=2712224 RepID=UPI002418A639|nr:hypothetical protein [Nocardioides convexus]
MREHAAATVQGDAERLIRLSEQAPRPSRDRLAGAQAPRAGSRSRWRRPGSP